MGRYVLVMFVALAIIYTSDSEAQHQGAKKKSKADKRTVDSVSNWVPRTDTLLYPSGDTASMRRTKPQ